MIQKIRTDYMSTVNPPPHTVAVNSERPDGPDRYFTHAGEPVTSDRRDIKSTMMDIVQVTNNIEGLAYRIREKVCGGHSVEPPGRPESNGAIGLVDGLAFLLRRLEYIGGALGETDFRLGGE